MASKTKRVDDIWNAMKMKEASCSLRNRPGNSTNWNSFHIKDVAKPKKLATPSSHPESLDSHLADYSLMEAAHIFLNSEGELQVGCRYDCKDTYGSITQGEKENGEASNSKADARYAHTDHVTTRYAKLKAAYQDEKSRVLSGSRVLNEPASDISISCSELKVNEPAETLRQDKKKELDGKMEESSMYTTADITGSTDECVMTPPCTKGLKNSFEKKIKNDGAEGGGSPECSAANNSSRSVHFDLQDTQAIATEPCNVSSTSDLCGIDAEENSEKETLAKALNRNLNCLVDPATAVRYAALLSLQYALLGSSHDNRNAVVSEGEQILEFADRPKELGKCTLCWATEELVTKPLLRRFADSSEKCRQLSIAIVLGLLLEVPSAVVALLPYVLPVIAERLPLKIPLTPASDDDYLKEPVEVQAVLVEKSEEVRLQLVQLMHSLLKQAPRLIHAFASDVASILVAATFDSHPEVLLETFPTLALFGEIMGYKIKPVAKQIVKVVLRSLSHNRYRVRVAALKAIHRLVMCGAHDSIYELTAYRDPNLVPIKCFYGPDPKTQYFALLATDRNASVREELLRTIASWLRELDERKEHEVRLIPYLLAGFQDPSPHLQDLSFQLMDEVGLQYEEENEKEVKDMRVYLTEDIDDIDSLAWTTLPHPFKRLSRGYLEKPELIVFTKEFGTGRPCLGARIMVKSVAAIILHAIAGDLECWTCGTKDLAANFLYTLLLFAEENITMHLQPMVKLLHKGLSEASIAPKILESARLLGFFVEPSSYLPILMPRVTGDIHADVSVQTVGHALHLLAGILKGSHADQVSLHIPEICSTLTDRHLMTSIQQDVNEGVIAVAEQLVRAWQLEESNQEVTAMMWLLLNAAAAADFCSRPIVKAETVLKGLAVASGFESAEVMVATNMDDMLEILPHPRVWALRSLDALVYSSLLRAATLVNVDTLGKLVDSFQSCIRESVDDDVKLRLLHEVQLMLTTGPSEWANGKKHLGHLLEGFLLPCLKHGESLLFPTLEAIQAILSKSWPTSLTSKTSFRDALENLMGSVERCFHNSRDQDQGGNSHSVQHEGQEDQVQEKREQGDAVEGDKSRCQPDLGAAEQDECHKEGDESGQSKSVEDQRADSIQPHRRKREGKDNPVAEKCRGTMVFLLDKMTRGLGSD